MSTYTEGFFVTIRRNYGLNCTILLKRWSKLNEKLARTEAKKTFLVQCRKTKKYPHFISDRTDHLMQSTMGSLSNKLIRRADFINMQVRARLLNFHISSVHSDIAFIHRQMSNIFIQLEHLLPSAILDQYESSLSKKYNFFLQKSLSHLQNKLNKLGTTPFNLLPFHEKWIKNLTDIQIPNNVLKLLSLGPKFGLQPSIKDYSICNFVADIENILSQSETNDLLKLRSSANNILTNFSHKPSNAKTDFDLIYEQASTFLKKHPDLMVLTSDKGNATVLMMREQYINLSQQLLDDSKYYQPLLRNPTSTYTNKINRYITELKNKKIIDEKLAKSLHNYNGYAPRFYCLPKIHKPQLSMRPILSSINAPNTNIAQFLTNILSQAYNYDNDFNITDSFQFSEFINNYQLPRGFVLVSFDVVSLFTNLPLSSVLTSLRNHWNQIQPHSPISWETFSELLKLIFDTNYLIFNDKYYRQIFGTPMGSTISPILVNFVLDDLINDSIKKLDFQVPFVKRYVDDLILATPSDKAVDTLSVFNCFDPHLQFTCEFEVDNILVDTVKPRRMNRSVPLIESGDTCTFSDEGNKSDDLGEELADQGDLRLTSQTTVSHDLTVESRAGYCIDEIMLRFETPREVLSDNGVQFDSDIIQSVAQPLGFSQSLIPVYHPATNSVERKNHDQKTQLIILTLTLDGNYIPQMMFNEIFEV
ncbi:uncharacterized protein [Diabrotica undecimpunctata]|uniref:uncharacterized protein n=1 Tax=Diabrotica undecimpunctata TaxID=50387 RepID=UPI003B631D71